MNDPATADLPAAPGLLGPWETSVSVPVYCRDAGGVIVASNPAFNRKFGSEGREMSGTAVESLLHPDDRPSFRTAAWPPARNGHESARTYRWQTSRGWRWFACEESAVGEPGDSPVAVRVVCRDITRQRLAEELYLKLSGAVDQSPIAIAITDAEGRIQYVNPRFVQSTGHSLEDILDQKLEILREGHASEESYQLFWATIHAGGEWRGETCRRRPDGTAVWESVHVSCMRGPSGEITNMLCLREDITERRRLQDELRQAQKMESLGTLAGGVAHDFNNLLTVVTGYADIAALHPDDPVLLQRSLREIIRAAQRAGGLVRQILTFSRKTEIHFAALDLNQLVRELVALFSETFPRNITFSLDLGADLPPLLADPNQLQQVVLNLCVNARDAMPSGGVLSIRTTWRPGAELAGPHANPRQNYALLQIGDTGVGMTPEVRSRIFEPFFTTKQANQGTGLGLAVVYGIVTAHRGFLDVESSPGAGSTFNVHLPIANEGRAAAVLPPAQEFPGGTESILVVDDEDPLRQLLQMALSRKGYRVTCASNGLDAIDLIADLKGSYDAVLLDLNMPGATGMEVLRVINAIRPGLPVMIVSGDIRAETRAEIEKLGVKSFVQKPCTLDDLGRRLRFLLEK